MPCSPPTSTAVDPRIVKTITRRLRILAASLLFLVLLGVAIATAPKNPVALIRVVDGMGNPIARAVVLPEGLRTKPGPYVSGWYSWRQELNGVPNPPVITDNDGYARVPYPNYVFEMIRHSASAFYNCLSALLLTSGPPDHFPYCSSLTFSIQSTTLPSSCS